MAWIESHTGLERHPKMLVFKSKMRWSKNEAIGFLHRFWWTVLEYAPDGVISALSPVVMSETLGMGLDQFNQAVAAMEDAELLRRSGEALIVHDWLDYAGRYLQENKYRHKPEKWQEVKRAHDMSMTSQGQANVPNQPTNQPETACAVPSSTEEPKPKPEPKPRKPPTGPHAEVNAHYVARWEQRYGAPRKLTKSEFPMLARLLEHCGGDPGKAKRVIDVYLANKETFYRGHPLTKLTSNDGLPKFIASVTPEPQARRVGGPQREDN